jgi:hypothetical protein
METVVFEPESAASSLVAGVLGELLRRSDGARRLAEQLLTVGTRLGDALDALGARASDELRRELDQCGFRRLPAAVAASSELWAHPKALLPIFNLRASDKLHATLRVESVVDFLEATAPERLDRIEGAPFALVRRVRLAANAESELFVAERRAERYRVALPGEPLAGPGAAAIARHLEAFRLRPRPLDDPQRGFDVALGLARAARAELGASLACEVFFDAERRFYERKNRAARLQKARQDALGLGWFNSDHHTYRSSRTWFRSLIAVLEALGMQCRERFYAGRDAGWGAQVLEEPGTGLCVFADVDLSPEELAGDFSHLGLEARSGAGTVGLWCELYGEALLAAGMHHLECQFDMDAITRQLESQGVKVMQRFTDYPHLKQAFTEGERWPVAPARLERALANGLLNPVQAERLQREGALGSHFEVLERNAGYKGFNQDGINKIILATDPRRAEMAPQTSP